MDAYEATRVVFSRIQALDPDNAAKIMGLLLIQDHGEKEMIRLAFGPESLLHSLVLKARKDLALPVSSPSPFLLSRQSSSSRLMPPSPLAVTSPSSWGQPQPFSRSNSNNGAVGDELQNHHDNELISPTNPAASPFYGGGGGGGGGGDLIDEFQLQDQLSFLNDTQSPSSMLFGGGGFLDECRSPGGGDGMMLQYGMGWPGHRRSCSVTDSCLGGDPAGFGWRPCLYFARGYCKNGSSCRFLHGLPDDVSAINTNKMDGTGNIEQQCHDALLLRSKSQRLASSQLMASAAAFPYSPTSASMPPSPSSKCMSFLLQQQQNDSQRAAMTAAAMMLGGDETHKFLTRSRSDFAGMVNPSSRQIYLTFPADSTFREEDVSNYFSIYGPVQDVRIPYQQKRMFGFVTFVYPETVKLILAKGNPHFVCDSRVLVKPYKEKGKVPDKSKQQTSERGDFSGCTTPTGLDPRDPFDLQLGSRMMFNSPDVLLRRKLEEQQQAAELQQAIEMQARRFMGLQLLDLKNRTLSSSAPPPADAWNTTTQAGGGGGSPPDDKSRSLAPGPATAFSRAAASDQQAVVSPTAADTEESAAQDADSDFQEGIVLDHNLPDSPFASPTKSAAAINDSGEADNAAGHLMASSLLPPTSSLDMASFKSCFFQMPRFNSSHGAVGM